MYSFEAPRMEAINKVKSPSPENVKYNLQPIQTNMLPACFYHATPRPTAASPIILRYVNKDAEEKGIKEYGEKMDSQSLTPCPTAASPVIQCYFDEAAAKNVIDEYEDKKDLQSLKNLNNVLRAQGVIRGAIEDSGHDSVYVIYEKDAYKSPKLFKTFAELIGFLRKRVKEAKEEQENPEGYIRSQVLFGNEFTFRNRSSFVFDHNVLNSTDEENKKKISNAKNMIETWVRSLPTNIYGYKPQIKPGRKKWAQDYNAYLIKYYSEETKYSWYFNIDLDPNCIEIQTKPIPFTKFIELRPVIDAAIFAVARDDLKLEADKDATTGGGGHISFDVETAFKGNAQYLKNFLVSYANEARIDANTLIHECKDEDNAPFLHQLEKNDKNMYDKFLEIIHSFDQLPPEEQTIEKLVDLIQKEVYSNSFTTNMKQILSNGTRAPSPEDAYHYQAVNLEHVNEPGGRVEMRRFNAQENTDETISQFELLINLLLECRR